MGSDVHCILHFFQINLVFAEVSLFVVPVNIQPSACFIVQTAPEPVCIGWIASVLHSAWCGKHSGRCYSESCLNSQSLTSVRSEIAARIHHTLSWHRGLCCFVILEAIFSEAKCFLSGSFKANLSLWCKSTQTQSLKPCWMSEVGKPHPWLEQGNRDHRTRLKMYFLNAKESQMEEGMRDIKVILMFIKCRSCNTVK